MAVGVAKGGKAPEEDSIISKLFKERRKYSNNKLKTADKKNMEIKKNIKTMADLSTVSNI